MTVGYGVGSHRRSPMLDLACHCLVRGAARGSGSERSWPRGKPGLKESCEREMYQVTTCLVQLPAHKPEKRIANRA